MSTNKNNDSGTILEVSSKSEKREQNRRRAIQNVARAGGLLAVGMSLPSSWTKPVVNRIMLPAHAQTSVPVPAAPRMVDPCGLTVNCAGATPIASLTGSIDQPIPGIAIFGSIAAFNASGAQVGNSGAMSTVTTAAGTYGFPNWNAPAGTVRVRADTGITGATGPGSTASCEVAGISCVLPTTFSLTCSITATSPVGCDGNQLDIVINGSVSSNMAGAETGVSVGGAVTNGGAMTTLTSAVSGSGGAFTITQSIMGDDPFSNPVVTANLSIPGASSSCMTTINCAVN